MFTALVQDLRYATRLLWRSPGFAAVCITTVALAIGANTAIFSVMHGVMLKALPFAAPERLVVLGHHTSGSEALDSTTPGNLYDWMRAATAFESIAGFAPTERIVTVDDGAERIRGGLCVGPLFEVLGRQAVEGRSLTAADDDPGAPRVVVLSARLARRLFGGPARAVGQPLTINGDPHTVVGVMPADFAFFDYDYQVLGPGPLRRRVPRQPRPVLPGGSRPAEARRGRRSGQDAAGHGDGRHPPRPPAVHPERRRRGCPAEGRASRRRRTPSRAVDGCGGVRAPDRLRQPRQPPAGARSQPAARDGGPPRARRRARSAGPAGVGREPLAHRRRWRRPGWPLARDCSAC